MENESNVINVDANLAGDFQRIDIRPWVMHIHPQGWVYFVCKEKHAVTDDDVRDSDVMRMVTANCSQYPTPELDEGIEVHVQGRNDQPSSFGSLFVNNIHCVASYDLHEIKNDNITNLDPSTVNLRRRMYWSYLWYHPHIPTPARAEQDVADILAWFYTDNITTGSRSVVPFSKAECEDFSRFLKDTAASCGNNSPARTVLLAWILKEVASFRVSENYAKHTFQQSRAFRRTRTPTLLNVHGSGKDINIVAKLLINVLLFNIPWTYLAHVQSSSQYRGRITNFQDNWGTYIQRIVRDYSDFLLVSTVLLSATVGLLAVPEIGPVTQAAGIISAFTSLGSVGIGCFFLWRHQTQMNTSDSFTYIHNARHVIFGLLGHAILLSLPAVLLVWAVIAFAVAIIAYTLQSITNDSGGLSHATAWSIFGVCLLIIALATAALYTFSLIWVFRLPSRSRIWPQLSGRK